MRPSMIWLVVFVVGVAIGLGASQALAGGLTHDQSSPSQSTVNGTKTSQTALLDLSLEGLRKYTGSAPQHGTHLCSRDSHCGTGHKCCSGHCKAVVTC